jgi:Mg2+ and Co2+ transporter CorA
MAMNEIEKLINEVEDAAFACGEWDRNESEESYDEVLLRLEEARKRLLSAIRAAIEDAETRAERACHDYLDDLSRQLYRALR